MAGYALTEEDRRLIQELITQYRRTPLPLTAESRPEELGMTPEMYVARTPANGIPALTGVTPGNSECEIYQVIGDNLEVVNFTKFVYNLSATALAGDIWVPAYRDKFGVWFAAQDCCAAAKCEVEVTAACDIFFNDFNTDLKGFKTITGTASRDTNTLLVEKGAELKTCAEGWNNFEMSALVYAEVMTDIGPEMFVELKDGTRVAFIYSKTDGKIRLIEGSYARAQAAYTLALNTWTLMTLVILNGVATATLGAASVTYAFTALPDVATYGLTGYGGSGKGRWDDLCIKKKTQDTVSKPPDCSLLYNDFSVDATGITVITGTANVSGAKLVASTVAGELLQMRLGVVPGGDFTFSFKVAPTNLLQEGPKIWVNLVDGTILVAEYNHALQKIRLVHDGTVLEQEAFIMRRLECHKMELKRVGNVFTLTAEECDMTGTGTLTSAIAITATAPADVSSLDFGGFYDGETGDFDDVCLDGTTVEGPCEIPPGITIANTGVEDPFSPFFVLPSKQIIFVYPVDVTWIIDGLGWSPNTISPPIGAVTSNHAQWLSTDAQKYVRATTGTCTVHKADFLAENIWLPYRFASKDGANPFINLYIFDSDNWAKYVFIPLTGAAHTSWITGFLGPFSRRSTFGGAGDFFSVCANIGTDYDPSKPFLFIFEWGDPIIWDDSDPPPASCGFIPDTISSGGGTGTGTGPDEGCGDATTDCPTFYNPGATLTGIAPITGQWTIANFAAIRSQAAAAAGVKAKVACVVPRTDDFSISAGVNMKTITKSGPEILCSDGTNEVSLVHLKALDSAYPNALAGLNLLIRGALAGNDPASLTAADCSASSWKVTLAPSGGVFAGTTSHRCCTQLNGTWTLAPAFGVGMSAYEKTITDVIGCGGDIVLRLEVKVSGAGYQGIFMISFGGTLQTQWSTGTWLFDCSANVLDLAMDQGICKGAYPSQLTLTPVAAEPNTLTLVRSGNTYTGTFGRATVRGVAANNEDFNAVYLSGYKTGGDIGEWKDICVAGPPPAGVGPATPVACDLYFNDFSAHTNGLRRVSGGMARQTSGIHDQTLYTYATVRAPSNFVGDFLAAVDAVGEVGDFDLTVDVLINPGVSPRPFIRIESAARNFGNWQFDWDGANIRLKDKNSVVESAAAGLYTTHKFIFKRRGSVITGEVEDAGVVSWSVTHTFADLQAGVRIFFGGSAITDQGIYWDNLCVKSGSIVLQAATGVFTLTGNNATLAASAVNDFTLQAETGVFTLTGENATLTQGAAAITRTAKGTASASSTATTLTLASVAVPSGEKLLVIAGVGSGGGGTITSATWNGNAMAKDVSIAGSGGGAIFSYTGDGATGDIVVTFGGIGTIDKALAAVSIAGLASNAFDKSATASGTSTSPSSGNTATTTAADEYLCGGIITSELIGAGDGTWGGSFSDGQHAATTGTPPVRICEGYRIVAATGAYAAAKTGIANVAWMALIGTYK